MFQNGYQNQDTFCVQKVKICHFSEIPGLRYAITGSSISFDYSAIESSLKHSYSRLLQISICKNDHNSHLQQDCNYTEKTLSKNLKADYSADNEYCANILIPQLSISSKSGKRIEGGGGMEFAEDMGDDKHLLEYKLITSIYKNDTLIYMDNRAHWTEVISERGKKLHYQVPQEIIETLVTLSLEEYFKRVNK